jgi:bacterioferritin
VPNVQRYGTVRVGETVPEQIGAELDTEKEAISRLNDGIVTCKEAGDNGTRLLLEKILDNEEEHADWLETQLGLIDQIGAEHYLSQQLHS